MCLSLIHGGTPQQKLKPEIEVTESVKQRPFLATNSFLEVPLKKKLSNSKTKENKFSKDLIHIDNNIFNQP